MPSADGFLDELRKRGVVRAGLIYAAAAFALLEFADIAFPRIGLPDGAVNAVLWVGIAGFPVTLLAAWMIEVRAERDRGSHSHWLSPSTIAIAVALVALGVGAGLWWGSADAPEPTPTASAAASARPARDARGPAVAVLRFADLGGADALFAAGLSEEIGTVLARFPGIRVIAPSATSYFDEAGEDIRVLDDELGVQYLLRGTVQRSADRVRVSVQLLDAHSGSQLWGDRYDAELVAARIFDTQDEIARRVASTIADSSGVLLQLGRREARRRGTESLEAYDCVILGRAYLNVHTEEVHSEARACLERAVEIDPDYADAWAHLAYLYREEFLHHYAGAPDPLERSLATAQRAIDLEPSNAMGHFAQGFTLASLYRLDASVVALERVAALAPNDSAMLGGVAIYLAHAGRWERALEIADQVELLNPLQNGWVYYPRAMAHFRAGEYEQALAQAVQLRNSDIQTQVHLAAIYARLGRTADARATLEELLRMDADFAADPGENLRRIFLRDVAIERYSEALRLAGLEIEPGKPARIVR